MALPNVPHQTGRVSSGDVTIFYRSFGAKGRTPIVAMHGANYFDSYDWIGVAGALANDREVVTFDRRGWGESSWSPSKDYSIDAHISDALAVVGKMGWNQVIFMGHSASARVVISLAANFLDKTAGLIVVDPMLTVEPAAGGGERQTVGNPPTVFPSIEATMASFAKLNNPPRIASDRERALNALIKVEGGYMLKRDPDNGNARPIGEGAQMPQRPPSDVWKDLAAVKAPTIIVRGLKSDRWDNPAILERLTRDYPKAALVTVNAQHDVPNQAPEELIAHVRKFA
ncbi:MAG: esterase [Alphaproteobacteria bacterium]|jgi:non-heme chloroperoxidase|nr:esterase [Alphaproteobacteria bacterium]